METLTDLQKKMASTLVDRMRERVAQGAESLLIEEGDLAREIGQASWKRSNVDDLNTLLAFCDRKKYPPVSLLVVIPGLMKPEKSILIHAFKATLPAAEFNRRWKEQVEEILTTPDEVWEAFKADVSVGE